MARIIGGQILIYFVVFIQLVGLGVAVTGVVLLIIKAPTELVTDTNDTVLPAVVITCGVIIFILSIIGIAGAGGSVWQLVLFVSYLVVVTMATCVVNGYHGNICCYMYTSIEMIIIGISIPCLCL